MRKIAVSLVAVMMFAGVGMAQAQRKAAPKKEAVAYLNQDGKLGMIRVDQIESIHPIDDSGVIITKRGIRVQLHPAFYDAFLNEVAAQLNVNTDALAPKLPAKKEQEPKGEGKSKP